MFLNFGFGLFALLFCACVCATVASSKNRDAFRWFFLGLLLGPLAFAVAILPPLPAKMKHRMDRKLWKTICPECGGAVISDQYICNFCGFDLAHGKTDIILLTEESNAPRDGNPSSDDTFWLDKK